MMWWTAFVRVTERPVKAASTWDVKQGKSGAHWTHLHLSHHNMQTTMQSLFLRF